MFRKVARRNTLGFDEFDDDFFRNLQRFFIFFTHEYPSRFSVEKPVRWGMALTTMDKTGRGKQEETGHAPPRFFCTYHVSVFRSSAVASTRSAKIRIWHGAVSIVLISTATEMAKEEASSFWGRRLNVQRCCGGLFEGFRTGVQLTDILILRERLRI